MKQKQEQRIEQAQGLGWEVGWRTSLTAALYYPGLHYDWIEITVSFLNHSPSSR